MAAIEGGAQLQERGAESVGVVQDRQQFEEHGGRGFSTDELHVVTDRSRELETEAEPVGGLVGPATHGVSAGECVERTVSLDRVEDCAVLLQKVARLGIWCEERTNPSGACPNRASQEEVICTSIRNSVVIRSRHWPTHVRDQVCGIVILQRTC